MEAFEEERSTSTDDQASLDSENSHVVVFAPFRRVESEARHRSDLIVVWKRRKEP
jgi:hypothetical protein